MDVLAFIQAINRIGENQFNTQRIDAMYCVYTQGVEPTNNPGPKHGAAIHHSETMHWGEEIILHLVP
tara:strand:+ start:3990 stop:4190 length:201 start_codon:yes stop_codon:yes gene_type:complete